MDRDALRDVTVAIPGDRTSAHLALKLWMPEVKTTIMDFDAIQPAVHAGEVAAGVLIHEGQLTWKEEGLHSVVDLGAWWKEDTGLPLPLGGNGIRKDMGPELCAKVSRHLHDSIAQGLDNRKEGLAHAGQYGRGLTDENIDTFVGMYVNDWTLDYGERGREALRLFLARAHEAGLLPELVVPEFAD
jgi:1,4-dihydroxy-6-naphthoate synthase